MEKEIKKINDDMSANIKWQRSKAKMTQMDVAKELGVAFVTYNKWENNPTEIMFSNLLRIAEVLNCDYHLFFSKE